MSAACCRAGPKARCLLQGGFVLSTSAGPCCCCCCCAALAPELCARPGLPLACRCRYSSGDVLHAASPELESAALSACHRLSAAAAAAASGDALVAPLQPRAGAQRLECHVLATASQVLALGEVRRVDHSLKVGEGQALGGQALYWLLPDCPRGWPCGLTCLPPATGALSSAYVPATVPPVSPALVDVCRRLPWSWCTWETRLPRRS